MSTHDVDGAHDLIAELVDPAPAVLARALEHGAIVPWYQPQLDLESGTVRGAEALARWVDESPRGPARARPSDATFVLLFERYGMIPTLTDAMLAHACRAAASGDVAGSVAVNIGAADLADPAFPARLERVLARTALDPARLELELTERVPLERSGAVEASLAAIRDAGAHLVIDDFGTGAASIEYLRWMRPRAVKLPREYAASLGDEASRDGAIGRAVIAFARELGVELVVEGIEDEPCLALCTALGAHRAQGYHIGRPVSLKRYRRGPFALERKGARRGRKRRAGESVL